MTLTSPDVDRLRTRSVRTLFGGMALGTTALFAAVTVGPLVAEEMSGSATWSGLPGTAAVVGTALGTPIVSTLMARRGRRPGVVAGYTLGAAGAVTAVVAIGLSWFWLLLAGMIVLGFGNTANQLSRYVAGDLAPLSRRASTIGFVVWAGTVGALLGPNLLSPSGGLAGALGLPRLAGPLLVTSAAFVAAALFVTILLRPDPRDLAVGASVEDGALTSSGPVTSPWRRPGVQVGVAALVTGQAVMVFIMTMTPLHLRHGGSGLGAVGLVMSLHVVGMFAFAPLLGRLGDRIGVVPTVVGGQLALAAAGILAATLPATAGVVLAVPLWLLGLGWSASFVAGSTLLTRGLPYQVRARVQGVTDTLVWSTAAAASFSSGVVVATFGYAVLCLAGATAVAVPLAMVAARRRRLVPVAV